MSRPTILEGVKSYEPAELHKAFQESVKAFAYVGQADLDEMNYWRLEQELALRLLKKRQRKFPDWFPPKTYSLRDVPSLITDPVVQRQVTECRLIFSEQVDFE